MWLEFAAQPKIAFGALSKQPALVLERLKLPAGSRCFLVVRGLGGSKARAARPTPSATLCAFGISISSYCIALHITLRCIALHCIALHCITLRIAYYIAVPDMTSPHSLAPHSLASHIYLFAIGPHDDTRRTRRSELGTRRMFPPPSRCACRAAIRTKPPPTTKCKAR